MFGILRFGGVCWFFFFLLASFPNFKPPETILSSSTASSSPEKKRCEVGLGYITEKRYIRQISFKQAFSF